MCKSNEAQYNSNMIINNQGEVNGTKIVLCFLKNATTLSEAKRNVESYANTMVDTYKYTTDNANLISNKTDEYNYYKNVLTLMHGTVNSALHCEKLVLFSNTLEEAIKNVEDYYNKYNDILNNLISTYNNVYNKQVC